ncbi:MAG TPA: DUF4252 domain-containing protein [Candidatus Binatia bacterium]|nr:DUF4252 domain-containing protein [Candidatus Binatia bacterium]
MRRLFIALFAVLATVCVAQEQDAWVPQGIDTLRQSSSSHTGFSLDHSMLVLAAKLDPDNEDLQRVIAGVSGVSVRNYRFQGAAAYDPESLKSVNDEYRTAGWKRVLDRHGKADAPEIKDVWVRMENKAIANVAVMVARPTEVTFVSVAGSISPEDVVKLGGHFGIPKIEGGVEVPSSPR